MKHYVLISYYNRGTSLQPSWEVYGHLRRFNNDLLMSFPTESQAREYAHSLHGVPVMHGGHDIYEPILEKLERKI